MSTKKIVVAGAIVANAGLLVGLYFYRRAENEAAEARAAVAAMAVENAEAQRLTALRLQARENVVFLTQALVSYADAKKSFPAATHPHPELPPQQRLSWIAELLPYLEQQEAFQAIDFTKGWEAPVHRRLTELSLPRLLRPIIMEGEARTAGITQYVGIGGLGAGAPFLPVTDRRAGVFGYNRVTTLDDIQDGASNTMMVAECNQNFGPWIAGGPSTIRSVTNQPYIQGPDGIGGSFPGGAFVGMADGSVRFVSVQIRPGIIEGLSTINGKE